MLVCADVSLDLGVDALADELVIREPGTSAGQQGPHTFGDDDLLRIFPVELDERLSDLVLQPGLARQVRLALEILRQGFALVVMEGAGQESIGAAGDGEQQTGDADDQMKTTPHDHAIILPTTNRRAIRRNRMGTDHHEAGEPADSRPAESERRGG